MLVTLSYVVHNPERLAPAKSGVLGPPSVDGWNGPAARSALAISRALAGKLLVQAISTLVTVAPRVRRQEDRKSATLHLLQRTVRLKNIYPNHIGLQINKTARYQASLRSDEYRCEAIRVVDADYAEQCGNKVPRVKR
jgi:hypothetical protein